jgi:hypothetical protein
METQTTTALIVLGERHFDHGYSCGRLWYFNAGVIRSNGRQNWRVPYEEAVTSGVKYNWTEDYEI